ncbi:hypothetical protein Pcinc_031388 [Petrolisthes cinctipes]|uniref:Sushi domain-containing protein n=1 Tax=Petrolisthes cinctipes TaxID=88211 RepID=A0AAE1K4L1_PETCI|nr:hypothetical protein Pcinc_031388 [Petrolisthes cinctipes]
MATTDRDPNTNYTVDATVTATCDESYEVSLGVNTYDIMCNKTGWNPSQTCHKVCTSDPPSAGEAMTRGEFNTNVVGTKVNYTCDENLFTLVEESTTLVNFTEVSCGDDGMWSITNTTMSDCLYYCQDEPTLTNSNTDYTTTTHYKADDTITITCKEGHTMDLTTDEQNLTCTTDGWTPDPPTPCYRACLNDPPEASENMTRSDFTINEINTTLTYTCNSDMLFVLDAEDPPTATGSVKCLDNGQWSRLTTFNSCGTPTSDPPPYDNNTMVLSGIDGPYAPNSVQKLTCAPNTISFTGEEFTMVTYDGTTWIKENPAFDCFQKKKENMMESKTTHQPSRQCVVFMKNDVLSSTKLQVIKLRHPCTDTSAMYMFDKDKAKLYEFYAFDEGHRSWFLGETVQCDGKLYVTTPVDVTYLVLPYLTKATVSVPLDHLLDDPDFPAISCLADAAATRDFSHIADRKGNPELGVWKYNEEKTLVWLAGRVKRLASLLQERKVPTSSAQSFTYVRTMTLDETKEAYLELAHGILSDYLSDTLSKALRQHLQLPEVRVKKKAPSGVENQAPPKKRKSEGPLDDYSKDSLPANKGDGGGSDGKGDGGVGDGKGGGGVGDGKGGGGVGDGKGDGGVGDGKGGGGVGVGKGGGGVGDGKGDGGVGDGGVGDDKGDGGVGDGKGDGGGSIVKGDGGVGDGKGDGGVGDGKGDGGVGDGKGGGGVGDGKGDGGVGDGKGGGGVGDGKGGGGGSDGECGGGCGVGRGDGGVGDGKGDGGGSDGECGGGCGDGRGEGHVEQSNTPQNAKARALAKSASGSKSITSFFTKK